LIYYLNFKKIEINKTLTLKIKQ